MSLQERITFDVAPRQALPAVIETAHPMPDAEKKRLALQHMAQMLAAREAVGNYQPPKAIGEVRYVDDSELNAEIADFRAISATTASSPSPPDAEVTVRAVRIARAIMTAPAMAPFQVSEVAPGPDRTTDDEILDWVKKAAETSWSCQ